MDNENTPSIGVEYDDLCFRTVGNRTAVSRIDKLITQLVEALHDEDAEAKKNVVSGEITIKIRLEHVLDTHNINVGVSASAKLPALRGSYQAGMARGHSRIIVPLEYDDDDPQAGMFDRDKPAH